MNEQGGAMNEQASQVTAPVGATIRETMAVIDSAGLGIALLIDDGGRLVGTASDGDLRRALLAGADLDDPVHGHAAPDPTSVATGASRAEATRLMRDRSLSVIPVLDDAGRVVGLHLLKDLLVPLAEPSLSGNVMRYLQECVESNFVSSVGPFVDRFEREFAATVGAGHAVACTSGTAALHVALRLAGAAPGALVAVPTFTFIASANAVAYTGADLLLVDSELDTWNLDGARLHEEVERRARVGERLPDVIQVVHILGHPAAMEPLLDLRDRYGIRLVEDAAESLGGTYTSGQFAGRWAGTIGEVGGFSFNGNKIITTGGGGMIVTDDPDLAVRARHLTTQAKLPGRGYVHDEVGYNYRLSNLSAAVGVAQLEDLDAFLAAKRRLAARYDEALADTDIELPPRQPWADPTYWLYSVLLPDDGAPAETVLDDLNAVGAQARPVWPPLHQQRPYAHAERLGGDVADAIYRRGVSLPSSVSLREDDQDWVIDALRRASQPA